ncbi:hypothetical protein Q9L58_008557 [Maublancomyces gigas]|uniref:PHD and RING finger domain-containing protein n=1 Tax=Discina gigas TaxID=1032678 RepID=A0ABR3G9G7_9PEZI
MSESSPDPDSAPPPHVPPHHAEEPPAHSLTATDLRQDPDAVTCIVCLIDLPQDSVPVTGEYDPVAILVPCNHAMHNSCLVPWMERANSCPICRATFNQVSVSATLSGAILETYPVKDKIQVQQYDDPLFDEEEGCEVCVRGENPDDLLICDDCDRSFHTYCLGLDSIPSGATWYCPGCCERHRAGRLTSGLYAPARSRTRQALRSGRGTRTVGAVRRLQQQTHYDTLRREDRAWRNAWQHLDSDLEFLNDDHAASVSLAEEQLRTRQAARMIRRREVAAAQTDGGPNAFDQPLAWMTPTSRPRTFPHSQQPISEEERSAWRMFDIAEGIEISPRKRSRGSSRELTRSPVSEDDKPRRKRPRTRRDSQLVDGNNKNGESLGSTSVAPGLEDPVNVNSTASGSYLGSILESIAKSTEATLPDPPLTGLWGIDLSKMRPLSPEPSNAASPHSRPISPVGASPFSPTSPPRSRPHSPVQTGQIPFLPSSPTRRTPVVCSIQSAPARAWELSPSPPTSCANSPIQQQRQRHHSCSSSDREDPGSDDNPGGASSSSDTDSRSSTKGRHRQRQHGENHSSITAQDKADIAEIVRSVLKPLYPEKLSKDDFTEINKSVSRKLYQLVEADKGRDVATEKEKWMKVAEEEVMNAVECL